LAREKFGGDRSDSAPRTGDTHESNARRQWFCRRMLSDDCGCTGADRRVNKAYAVSFAACDRDEHVTALDGAAIRCHSADFDIGVTRVEFRVSGRNVAKLHVKLLISVYAASVNDAGLPAFFH
jgi:hypothetical protein